MFIINCNIADGTWKTLLHCLFIFTVVIPVWVVLLCYSYNYSHRFEFEQLLLCLSILNFHAWHTQNIEV